MPQQEREAYNAYMRDYMLRRYYRRREAAIEQLGGKCIDCGTSESLEFDHVSREDKTFTLGKGLSSWSESRIQSELKKCVLRCSSCHSSRTLAQLGRESARDKHGTLSSYRYCKCETCKAAKSEYNKQYNQKTTGATTMVETDKRTPPGV